MTESKPWSVVTVAGVGLIGGSFAMALRKAGFAGKLSASARLKRFALRWNAA